MKALRITGMGMYKDLGTKIVIPNEHTILESDEYELRELGVFLTNAELQEERKAVIDEVREALGKYDIDQMYAFLDKLEAGG